MSRHSIGPAVSLVLLAWILGSPLPAQPPAAAVASDPLDLARGLRDQGMSDLALEYLQELEQKPGIADSVKLQIPLERAKSQLDAASDEPDEGTRISLIGEAKEGFLAFVRNPKNTGNPRMSEAFLALARLTSLDAKAQLARARRIDVPAPAENGSNNAEIEEAKERQNKEAAKARPIFKAASDQLKSAIAQVQKQLDANPDPLRKKSLQQTLYEAEIARGTNQLAYSETFLAQNAKESGERSKAIDEAQAIFQDLVRIEGAPASVTGLARAWVAECYNLKEEFGKAEEESKRIEALTGPEAEEAKRMIKFFKVRREFLSALGTPGERALAELHCRDWLRQYGSLRRAQSEAFAIRWYLGFLLQLQADALMPKPPATPPKSPTPVAALPPAARTRYAEAEKLYRQISQTDNEYTQRASRQRMYVVRRLLGEADQPPSSYKSFEECQMASLIQMARTIDLQREPEKNAEEIQKRYHAIVALLERARELATPQDNPADIADVNLRLIFYYQRTDQPYQAAILGDHMARTTKAPGGKSSLAGRFGIDGYIDATDQIKGADPEKLDAMKKADRDRSIDLARFIDRTFPNDLATDSARRRLAGLLYEEQKPVEAYDMLLKIRPGYESISQARLFQGALADQLLSTRDSPLPENRRREVFRRTTSDLDKLVKPLPSAPEEEVRPYILARCRLVRLYIQQSRIDPDGERLEPGFAKARKIAEETLSSVPTFNSLIGDAGTKSLNLDGWELRLHAEDAKTKSALAEGDSLFVQGKLDEAYKLIGEILAEMNRTGPFASQVRSITQIGVGPMPKKEPDKKEPAPIPKKELEKKDPSPPPKKNSEPKKGLEPKAEPEPKTVPAEGNDPDKAQKERVASMAIGVDTFRQRIIVLALKIRVKQGDAEKGIEQLDLLERFGGSIETNIATLEQMTAEMSAQIASLKRDKKEPEAKALSEGFSKLLDKLSSKPGLSTSIQRFLGQSLIVVGDYEKAAAALRKVPPPANRELLAKPNEIADPVEKQAALEYRRATLELLRAYRLSNNFPQADAVLAQALGTPEKPGWGSISIDFRKEKAFLFEAKGAAAPGAAGKPHWAEALREWTSLANAFRAIVAKGPQAGAGGGNAYLAAQNNYFDMYLNHQRCGIRANIQLLAGNDTKLNTQFENMGRNFVSLEMLNSQHFNPEVREKYYDTLREFPALKNAYEKALAAALPTAETKAKEREKDAADYRARAEKLPESAPERAQLLSRAKTFTEDAEAIRKWAAGGGKFFLEKPMTSN